MSICHLILNSINFLCNCYIFDKDNGSIDEIQPILEKNCKNDENFDFKSEINVEINMENPTVSNNKVSYSNLSITSSNDTICTLLTSPNDTICSENSISELIIPEKFNENLSENNSENSSEHETKSEYTSDEDCLFEF